MARKRILERVILAVLVIGAVVFGLLLAGIGSGVLTNPPPSTPFPAPSASVSQGP